MIQLVDNNDILDAINKRLGNIATLYKNLQLLAIKTRAGEYTPIIHIYIIDNIVAIKCNIIDENTVIEIGDPELFNKINDFVNHLRCRVATEDTI